MAAVDSLNQSVYLHHLSENTKLLFWDSEGKKVAPGNEPFLRGNTQKCE